MVLLIGAMFLCMTTLAGMAEARGGGRGGGFSRSSAASGGSFSSRSAAQPSSRQAGTAQRSTQQGSRQESASQRQEQRQDTAGERQGNRDEAREDRQQHRDQNREDWQDFAEDEYHGDWDDHWHGDDTAAAFAVGAAVGMTAASQSSYVTTLPCSGATVIVNGAPYYQCGSTWYSSGYMSGTVVYTVSGPPPGY
jgi:hypothetical protein